MKVYFELYTYFALVLPHTSLKQVLFEHEHKHMALVSKLDKYRIIKSQITTIR
jgi:hypothetical protein